MNHTHNFTNTHNFTTSPRTSAEALTEAGLNFNVTKLPLKTISTGFEIPGKYATWRTDKLNDANGYLGTVGNNYTIIQNQNCMNFFDNVMSEEELKYTSAGYMDNGARVYLQVKLPGQLVIGNTNDNIDKYILLSNSHNGTSSMMVKLTTIRLACYNQLNLALNKKTSGNSIAIRHCSNSVSNIKEAHKILGIAKSKFKEFEQKINMMANMKVSAKQVDSYFDAVLDIKQGKEVSTKTMNRKELMTELFKHGRGQELNGGTVWSLLNSVTEYVDHHKNYKNGEKNNGILFGSGDAMKMKAEQIAESMLVTA